MRTQDGQIKMAEYATSWSDDVVADFAQFDLNGDGIVTPAECLQAVDQGAVQGAGVALASSQRVTRPRVFAQTWTSSSSSRSDAAAEQEEESSSAEPAERPRRRQRPQLPLEMSRQST